MSFVARQLSATYGFVERNWALTRRYIGWEVVWLVYGTVSTLTIGLIGADSQGLAGQERVLYLLIGALLWSYLSVLFQIMGETVAWERWEGTIEYTFMAPVHRFTYLSGQGLFAVTYGMIRTALILGITVLWFDLDMSHANLLGGFVVLAVASVSFLGLGLVAAVLPLLSPERGPQATHIIQGLLLLCSSVYYQVTVLPGWLQPFAKLNPATYALDAIRATWIGGVGLAEVWPALVKLLVTGAVLVPIGLLIFQAGERYALRTGKLKRNG
ncbi:MAG TPA: ABC transporter permease [Symbiobacteriaceae bacterium]|nr:ABC transporter permease [Symbiobacteriaceae bacterium]